MHLPLWGSGEREGPAACGLLRCTLGLGGSCTEKLSHLIFGSVLREMTLIFSDVFESHFQHVPAGQLQVSEIKIRELMWAVICICAELGAVTCERGPKLSQRVVTRAW